MIAMKYLFLCAMGQNRSPTAASVARELADERRVELEAFYGGIDGFLNASDKTVFMNGKDPKEHFGQYDKIFVMEPYMIQGLEGILGKSAKLVCLYIPDDYRRDDPELVDILRNNLGIFI